MNFCLSTVQSYVISVETTLCYVTYTLRIVTRKIFVRTRALSGQKRGLFQSFCY